MRKYCLLVLLQGCLLLTLPQTSVAYGVTGHRIIATFAQEDLTPEAAAEVARLLEGQSLADVSAWADEMRSNNDNPQFWGYDHAANWHFINTEPGLGYTDSSKNPAGDAYMAIIACSAILMDQPIPSAEIRKGLTLYFGDLNAPEVQRPLKQFALRFLVHLVADIHQPLHVAFAEDRGGNTVTVNWFGDTTNLHSVWDSRLLAALASNQATLLEQLRLRRESVRVALQPVLPPFEWIADTAAIRERVYDAHGSHPHYDDAYVAAFGDIAQDQLLKASVRLAWLLNRVFRDPP